MTVVTLDNADLVYVLSTRSSICIEEVNSIKALFLVFKSGNTAIPFRRTQRWTCLFWLHLSYAGNVSARVQPIMFCNYFQKNLLEP